MMWKFVAIVLMFVSGCKQVSSDLTFNLVESKNKYGVAPTISFKMSWGTKSGNFNTVSEEKKDGKEQSGKNKSKKD